MEMPSSSLIEMGAKQSNGFLKCNSKSVEKSIRPVPKPRKSLMNKRFENGSTETVIFKNLYFLF